jgi:hypothetical protein
MPEPLVTDLTATSGFNSLMPSYSGIGWGGAMPALPIRGLAFRSRRRKVDDAGELSLAEYYGLIRTQIEHEDTLVNQRVIWQIISQAFIFSAYATLLNAPKEAKTPLLEASQLLLVWVLPVAALCVGLLTSASIRSSVQTISYLGTLYEEYSQSKAAADPSSKLYPDIQGPRHLRKWAQFSPIAIPVLFMVTWSIVLVRLLLSLWQQ